MEEKALGDHWYIEAIKTLRNRCDIALKCSGDRKLLATITEDIYDDAHRLIESYCIESKSR